MQCLTISYLLLSTAQVFQVTLEAGTTKVEVNDLQPATTYTAKITTISNGVSSDVKEFSFTTC